MLVRCTIGQVAKANVPRRLCSTFEALREDDIQGETWLHTTEFYDYQIKVLHCDPTKRSKPPPAIPRVSVRGPLKRHHLHHVPDLHCTITRVFSIRF
jgi:hypothetical protein